MKRRIDIPASIEAEVLFQNRHTCCICEILGKDVQIHHIDGEPANNTLGNLAVVCLDCHSRVTGSRGLGRRYSGREVRRYKRHWEVTIALSRKGRVPSRIRHEKELLSQIDLIVCDILASEHDIVRVKRLLQVLYELHLWKGNPRLAANIVSGLSHLAMMTALDHPRTAVLVADKAWEMCWHLAGPQHVPLDRAEVRTMLGCIGVVESIGVFNALGGEDRRAAAAAARSGRHLLEIGAVYRHRRMVKRALRMFGAVILGYKKAGFKPGVAVVARSLNQARRLFSEGSRSWKTELRLVDQLLRKAR